MELLDSIPFAVDFDALALHVPLAREDPFAPRARELAEQANRLAKPKGLYRLSHVEAVDDTTVRIHGRVFSSRVLRVNLDGLYRVFPFIATCGLELEAWSHDIADPLEAYWADLIKESALRGAIAALSEHLRAMYEPGETATMNPGSLEDWPLSEQRPFFALFDGNAAEIGVSLTESCLMTPIKSVSGLWFETKEGYRNCRLCPRGDCPNRQAPYDPHMFDRKYAKT